MFPCCLARGICEPASFFFFFVRADFIKSLERRAVTPESLNPAERLHAGACLRAHSQPEAL